MSEEKKETGLTIKGYFESKPIQDKFKEMLGKRATQFITTVVQISNSNQLLKNSEPTSLINAAITAATLDLPINPNLGFAYIVPYKTKKGNEYIDVAQFQMGYKGFIQLAQRSGQFKTISASPIYEGQIISKNPLTGYEFDFTKKTSETIIGFAAYFKLVNGFEKTLYLTVDQLKRHGLKFSQTFKKGYGLWKDDFEGMAIKTVLKLLLSKYAPLSVEMQRAVISDQGIINNPDNMEVTYPDNEPESIDIEGINFEKERNRIIEAIEKCEIIEKLEEIELVPDIDQYNVYMEIEQKKELLKTKTKK